MVMGFLGLISTLFGCSKKEEESEVPSGIVGEDFSEEGTGEYKKIQSFYYNVNGYNPGFDFDIKADENKPDKYEMTCNDYENGVRDKTYKVDVSTIESLSQLCAELNILSWDKFKQHDENVLDGSGFMLSITFEDGTQVYAQGENSFPKNYWDFEKRAYEILSALE